MNNSSLIYYLKKQFISHKGFQFIPFVIESLGGFGQQAVGFINHLATMLADRKGVDVSQ